MYRQHRGAAFAKRLQRHRSHLSCGIRSDRCCRQEPTLLVKKGTDDDGLYQVNATL